MQAENQLIIALDGQNARVDAPQCVYTEILEDAVDLGENFDEN